MSVRILVGDCLERLPELAADSIDACVTDPPYGLEFMGKTWDHGVPGVLFWLSVSRVLKPGAHLLAFGGTRTHHRLMVAIEDAGFEIRDCLMWLHGQGFPKGQNQLKPAWEPIILARKPLSERNVAANVLRWGTGGLNVDATRIGGTAPSCTGQGFRTGKYGGQIGHGETTLDGQAWSGNLAGRWPANVVLSHEPECREVGTKRVKTHWSQPTRGRGGAVYGGGEGYTADLAETGQSVGYADADGTEAVTAWECAESCAVRLLDEQSGERPVSGSAKNGRRPTSEYPGGYGGWAGKHSGPLHNDTGGASRFFYTAKASPSDRGGGNDHPTVKPTELMRWLVRLVTPPGGTVLDCFAGSGSTLIAADREGFDCVGIEISAEYAALARRRLESDAGMFADVETG